MIQLTVTRCISCIVKDTVKAEISTGFAAGLGPECIWGIILFAELSHELSAFESQR